MKWYLDTEFYERPGALDLISIGLVGSDGRELYMENKGFDWSMVPADHWLHENVRPHLRGGGHELYLEDIRDNILRVAGKSPKFYGWYCDYDWVVFCWIFGRMIDLPEHFPKFCHDLRQMVAEHHIDPASMPDQDGTEHDALEDARWNRLVHEHVKSVIAERRAQGESERSTAEEARDDAILRARLWLRDKHGARRPRHGVDERAAALFDALTKLDDATGATTRALTMRDYERMAGESLQETAEERRSWPTPVVMRRYVDLPDEAWAVAPDAPPEPNTEDQAYLPTTAPNCISPAEAAIVANFLQMPPEMDEEAVQIVVDVYRRLRGVAQEVEIPAGDERNGR